MQRIFLSWARAIAAALAAVVYLVVELVAPADRVLGMIVILCASVVAGAAYHLATRRFSPTTVLRVALPIDTLLIAGMTVALGRPGLLAIAYFWSIALAALLLGPRETLGNTLLAMVCAAVVPYLVFGHRIDYVIVVTDVLVLALVGGLLSLLPITVERAEQTLELEARLDAAALSIADRIRSTIDFDEIVEYALDEMQQVTGAGRAVLRLTGDDPHFIQRLRPGVDALDPKPSAAHLVVEELRQPVVYYDRDEARGDPGVLAYMERYDVQALIGYPVLEGGRVVGAIGFHDDKPRRWEDAVPLLDRVVPQLASALAQARLFARQRETVERLEELASLREELVATVSHELRTPLTSTIGFLRTLQRADVDFSDEQRDEFLQLALTQAERLGDLVTDLLELSRLERNVLPLEPARVDLGEVVREVSELAPGVPVLELEPQLVCHVDPRRIHQVVENLVANAFRHGAGDVVVRGERRDGHVCLEIIDHGPDIPDDVIPHLFVPFARWGAAEGSGLGLAIARGLVEAHGGTLDYRPSRAGRPHAFVVELPAA
jgi:signal transduction histidine kinase